MLAKCTNPTCTAPFRYLAEGRLFRLETDPTSSPSKTKATEYFWLCRDCSAEMTLCLAHDGSVLTSGLREALGNHPQVALASLSRESGRFLRSVSFVRSSISRVKSEDL
jgi:hypothetical protein